MIKTTRPHRCCPACGRATVDIFDLPAIDVEDVRPLDPPFSGHADRARAAAIVVRLPAVKAYLGALASLRGRAVPTTALRPPWITGEHWDLPIPGVLKTPRGAWYLGSSTRWVRRFDAVVSINLIFSDTGNYYRSVMEVVASIATAKVSGRFRPTRTSWRVDKKVRDMLTRIAREPVDMSGLACEFELTRDRIREIERRAHLTLGKHRSRRARSMS